MKKRILTFVMICILCLFARVNTDALETSEDADFLISRIATDFPDLSLAARVGVIEVIYSRTATDGYPKTAAGVIDAYRNSAGERVFGRRSSPAERDWRSYKMTEDAYKLATDGVMITGGATNFELIEPVQRRYDLKFDDTAEDEYEREMAEVYRKYRVVIDGVGFW